MIFKLLQYALERDVEEECSVRRYLRPTALLAVAQLRRHDELASSTNTHTDDAAVPALDHVACA